jgi:hypothetical protein
MIPIVGIPVPENYAALADAGLKKFAAVANSTTPHTSETSDSDIFRHPSGATSSALNERYDLIPRAALDALGRRLALGAKKHGADNWKKGDADYANERLNHLWQHLIAFTEQRKQEDLDAILANAAMLSDMKARGLMPEPDRWPNQI